MLQPIQEPRYGDVIPIPRDTLLEQWRSDAPAIIQQAEECGLELNEFLNVRVQDDPQDPRSACPPAHFLLESTGIRMENTGPGRADATLVRNLPDLRSDSKEPVSLLMNAHLDDVFREVLLSGRRALAALSNIQAGTLWRPYYDEFPVRVPQIGPDLDYRNVVARTRCTREDIYRINRLENSDDQNLVKVEAEGAEGKIVKLALHQTHPTPVSYTHLTLPTILLV